MRFFHLTFASLNGRQQKHRAEPHLKAGDNELTFKDKFVLVALESLE
jgi:hypothetical protein